MKTLVRIAAVLSLIASFVLIGLGLGCNPLKPAEPEFPNGTKWLHHDVSAWPVTAKMTASVSGGNVNVPFDKTKEWPTKNADGAVNANVWALVNVDGQWYAATWEWLRPGGTSKSVKKLLKTGGEGDHFKVSPLNKWTPKSGEKIGLMVSGLARSNVRNVYERSNVEWVVWP